VGQPFTNQDQKLNLAYACKSYEISLFCRPSSARFHLQQWPWPTKYEPVILLETNNLRWYVCDLIALTISEMHTKT